MRKADKRKKGKRGAGAAPKKEGPFTVVFHPSRFREPLPRRLVTEFWCEADYKIPIASSSIQVGSVKLNSVWLPFRPGGSSAFSTMTYLGPGAETTLQPTGYSTLFSPSLYGNYKVRRSTISVRWNGSNSGNNVVAVIVPTFNTTSVSSVYQLRTMPYAKEGSFSVSKPNLGTTRSGWLTSSINPDTYFGFDRLESKADIIGNTGVEGADPNTTMWWQVYLQSNDLDVSSTTASLFQVRMHWLVECMGLEVLPSV